MENFQKIAVLIDADNTQLSKLEAVLHEVSTYGRIVVKKAYGNWRKDSLKNWEPELKRLAIRAEQQFDYVTGKNTTDIAMVIGAMDLLHNNMYDALVLVSSDSDFTPLAIRLRESGLYIIGAGVTTTPESFKKTRATTSSSSTICPRQTKSPPPSSTPRSPRPKKPARKTKKGHTQHEEVRGRVCPGHRTRTGTDARTRTGAGAEKARHPRDPQPAAHRVREVSGRRRLCQRQLLGAVHQARQARFQRARLRLQQAAGAAGRLPEQVPDQAL